jgi:N-methylhydantoinase B
MERGKTLRSDPLTFEVLRHRICSIADEGSAVLSMVSSSPVAAEANDCNVAIMDRSAAAVAIGPGLSGHGIACMMTARYVRAEYEENPGIRQGDMFLANDPYHCTPHQTCIALVTPIIIEGSIVSWAGAGIHLPDMGGPVAGQVGVGANSIYQEATPILPLRIVEEGRIRKDIEQELIIRSRTPQQVALDLRALIAACNRLMERLKEMIATYSLAVVEAAFEDMIQFTRAHLVERLKQIPDGEWQSVVWLDYPDANKIELYESRLSIVKQGERLTLDFTETSPQAPAVINCGEPGLLAAVLNGVITLLGYGLPLCPEGVLRVLEIKSRPGTFVHAVHPAGCSKATTAACHAIRQALNMAIGKMFLSVPSMEARSMAGSSGFLPVIELEGLDQRGNRFGFPLLDVGLSAGYSATAHKDGIDSGGTLGSPFASIANVETYEYRYPILYLWRRHESDSGGMGKYRGGRGVSLAFILHRAQSPLGIVLHGLGCVAPSTPGIAGGHPGATNAFEIVRGSDVPAKMAGGYIADRGDLKARIESSPGIFKTSLAEGDVLIGRNNGGGGFGDPLEREIDKVREDLLSGAVSAEWARRGYGVEMAGNQIDNSATRDLRNQLRGERIAQVDSDDAGGGPEPLSRAELKCRRCDALVPAEKTLIQTDQLQGLGRFVLSTVKERFFRAEKIICLECGSLLEVNIKKA